MASWQSMDKASYINGSSFFTLGIKYGGHIENISLGIKNSRFCGT
ncbi:TPA: hypothetical protein ACOTG0_000874 [Clostridium perfringens]